MKNLANTITVSRMILSIVMAGLYANEAAFLVLYLLCGFSDFIDGYIARKTNSATVLGAKLDSIADLMMFAAIFCYIFLRFGKDLIAFIPLFLVIAAVRGFNLVFAGIKYHSVVLLHTYANKVTGILVFITLILYLLFRSVGFIWMILWIALFASLEEGVIHLLSQKADRNCKTVLFVNRKVFDNRKTG